MGRPSTSSPHRSARCWHPGRPDDLVDPVDEPGYHRVHGRFDAKAHGMSARSGP